jgi:prevent-host-death family protein
MREMQASVFKAQCLAVLDEVERTHGSVTITKHGRPVARLVPVDDAPTTLGSVTVLVETDDELFSTGEAWDAS